MELKQDILRAPSGLVGHAPDARSGRLIANLAVLAQGPTPEEAGDMEDDELLEDAKGHVEGLDRGHAVVVRPRPATGQDLP